MSTETISSQIAPTAKKESNLSMKQMREALGDTGTSINSGYIDEEYNHLFAGSRAYETYDEMYRSDSTVYKTLNSAMLPIQSANRQIKAFQQPDKTILESDQIIADCIQDLLLNDDSMDKPRGEFIEECLYMLRDGVSVFEIVLKINNDGKIAVKELATRMAKTIEKRETATGAPGIVQQLPQGKVGSGESSPSIPASKLLIFSYKKEGNNYAGISVLRHVAKNRIAKKNLENFELIGYETQFKGVKTVRLPRDTSSEERELYLGSIANFRAGNDNTIILPGTPEEFDFKFVTMELPQAADIGNAIQRHETKITDIMLGFFMKLGESKTGSYGQAKSDIDFFILGLEVVAKKICTIMNRFLIKRLVDRNFVDVKGYPTITFGELGTIDVGLLTESIDRMTTSGHITPDTETEQFVRETLSMPVKKEGTEDSKPTEKVIDEKAFHECGKDGYDGICNPSRLIGSYAETSGMRTLTFAEQKMNIPQIVSKLDGFESILKTRVTLITEGMKVFLTSAIKKAVENNDLKSLSNLEIPAKANKELASVILDVRRLAWEYGKDSVASEIKQPVIGTTPEQKNYIKLESDQLSDRMSDNITSAAQSAVNQEISRNGGSISTLTASSALKTVSDSINTTIVKGLGSIQSISIPGTFNTGRGAMHEKYTDKIYAYQYSAILDGRTTDRCISLDGRVVLPGSAEYLNYSPPQHYRCRSVRVSILQTETFKPRITGIPSNIPGVSNINGVQPLLDPSVLQNSPASDLLRQELEVRQGLLKDLEESGKYPNIQKEHRERISVLKRATN